jgi:hypothetical protein
MTTPVDAPVITFTPSRSWVSLRIRDPWELLYFLVWRDVKVRYKQTVLGAAWAIIQPLFTMAVFAVFFGLAKMPSDGDFLLAFSVLVPLLIWYGFGVSPKLMWLGCRPSRPTRSRSPAGRRPQTSSTRTPVYVVPFLTQFWLFVTPGGNP